LNRVRTLLGSGKRLAPLNSAQHVQQMGIIHLKNVEMLQIGQYILGKNAVNLRQQCFACRS